MSPVLFFVQALDLEEVTGYFSRTVTELESSGEKLDDRMQPLLDSQCGAVVKSTDRHGGGQSLQT